MQLILASGSPRRAELLSALGFSFDVVTDGSFDESGYLKGASGELAARVELLAEAKGLKVAAENPDAVVLSADTVVVLEESALGKPASLEEAAAMLRRLSGRTHEVFTAVAVQCHSLQKSLTAIDFTAVTFCQLSDVEIEAYIRREQVLDKAGAYAIQGLGALLIERISGDYSTVIGLPVRLTCSLLEQFGVRIRS